ncbi:MAG: citrate/2-methylcitrate synthase [Nitrososphaerales archaeon]
MSKGLEDVVAGPSAITFIDGARGRLSYRGYDIGDLAAQSNYEEVAYLLWNERLPSPGEFEPFVKDLRSRRALPAGVRLSLDSLSRDCDTMDAVEMAVAALGIYDGPYMSVVERAASVASKLGSIVAYIHQHKHLLPHLEPREDLGFAANLLYMLNGEEPDGDSVRLMDMILVLHADHELNASTFTARIVASTLSDMYSSVTAAVAALKGPLHGGANEEVVAMVEEVRTPERAEPYLLDKLARKEKVMGFGHRIYKGNDPRAVIIRDFAGRIARTEEQKKNLAILDGLAAAMIRERGIYPNLDFYSGFVLHYLRIPTYLFTPVFAVGRTPGWLAHVMEQYSNNRIIRPLAEYVGPRDATYVPIGERGSLRG